MSECFMPYQELTQPELQAVLASNPSVQVLYIKAQKVFGSSILVVKRRTAQRGAATSFGDSPKPAKALVVLNRDPENWTAEIAHELLHVKTAIDLFPVRIADCSGSLPPKLLATAKQIHNEIGHLIFHDAFVALGFRSEQLVENYELKHDLKSFKADVQRRLCAKDPFARGSWLAGYFGELVSREFGWPNQADEFHDMGREVFSSRIDDDAEWINLWLRTGAFRNPLQYFLSVNRLLLRFELPTLKMERLRASGSELEFVNADF